jgi:hypothetical protein
MPERDPRFAAIDLLEPSDLSAEIDRRAHLPESAVRPESPRRRIVAGSVAASIFTVAAVFAWSALRPLEQDRPVGQSGERSTPTPVTQGDPWRDLPDGATELPPPPEIRGGEVHVWTGTQLFVWGGNVGGSGDPPHEDDGWIFDARDRTWRPLPPSPLSARSSAQGVWTGREVLVWGGFDGSWLGDGSLSDGAAFDPATATWRALPAAPGEPFAPLTSVWTGSEAIFWGSVRGDGHGPGLAFDPATDAWRTIARAPAPMEDSVTAVWTGEEMLVLGGAGRVSLPNAAAYDPVSDAWRTVPDGGLVGNSVTLGSSGMGVVAADYNKRAALFTGDGWSTLPDLATTSCEGRPSVPTLTSDAAVVELCGDLGYIRAGDAGWHRALTDHVLVYPYAGAGDVALVMAYREYGDAESGRGTFFAFRPPSDDGLITRSDAEDLATAFAAIRSHYPFDSELPANIEVQMRAFLSVSGAAAWDEPTMAPLWAYYPGYEVLEVTSTGDATYEARIELTAYEGPAVREVIVMAPGADLDGIERDLVIVDARRVGLADHPPVAERADGTREVLLDLGDDAYFPSGILGEGDTIHCDGSSLLVPAPGTYVEDPPDEPGPDPNDGEGFSITANLDGSVEARCLPR